MKESSEGYELALDALETFITERTKVLGLNSPSNPTGSVLSKRDLERLVEIMNRRNIIILSDEVYSKFTFDGFEHQCLLAQPDLREKTIMINSFSKTYAMTGWRIGYTVAKKEFVDRMVLVQESISTCAPVFVQKAALAALQGPQDCVREMRTEYDLRRKLVMDSLSRTKKFIPGRPKGGLYVFPRLTEPQMSSVDLAELLLSRLAISTTPGIGFWPIPARIICGFL